MAFQRRWYQLTFSLKRLPSCQHWLTSHFNLIGNGISSLFTFAFYKLVMKLSLNSYIYVIAISFSVTYSSKSFAGHFRLDCSSFPFHCFVAGGSGVLSRGCDKSISGGPHGRIKFSGKIFIEVEINGCPQVLISPFCLSHCGKARLVFIRPNAKASVQKFCAMPKPGQVGPGLSLLAT